MPPRHVILTALLLLLSTACANDQETAPAPFQMPTPLTGEVPRSDSLVLAGLEPITLDPAISKESRSRQYIAQIFSGLVRLDENLRIVPDLAGRWEVLDSGTRYVFHLRGQTPGSTTAVV